MIREQLQKSLRDGEARQLAVKLVSGKVAPAFDQRTGDRILAVQAYNKNFLAPPGGPCETRSDECEIERIWDFVVLNLRYVYDTVDRDVYATLKESLEAGGADCDDMVVAFAALLAHIGFHVKARVISEKDAPDEPVHIYPMVGIPKDNPTGWVPLDATVKGAYPGWEYPNRGKVWDFDLV